MTGRPPFTRRARIETPLARVAEPLVAVALPSPGGRGLKRVTYIPELAGQVVALPSPGGRGLKLGADPRALKAVQSPSLHQEGAD